ncbi:MAG: helix-turn-helix domain-containing protein, partial [Candidatus Paceibacterota bacterium]
MEKDLNDKKFISTREASKLTGYTTDYIGQLCRGGLVIARKDGKGWLVQEDDLLRYKEGISLGIPQYENKPGNPKVSSPVESIYNKRSSNTDTDNIKNISSSTPLGYTSHSKVAVAEPDTYGRDEVKVSESMSAKNTSGEKNSGSQIPPSA